MSTTATKPKSTPKPTPTPAERRKALGLSESASDAEVRAAEKVARFKAVAKRRTDAALAAMHNLTRCANRGNYTYTDEQVDNIVAALVSEVQKVESAFRNTAGDDKPTVQL